MAQHRSSRRALHQPSCRSGDEQPSGQAGGKITSEKKQAPHAAPQPIPCSSRTWFQPAKKNSLHCGPITSLAFLTATKPSGGRSVVPTGSFGPEEARPVDVAIAPPFAAPGIAGSPGSTAAAAAAAAAVPEAPRMHAEAAIAAIAKKGRALLLRLLVVACCLLLGRAIIFACFWSR